MKASLGGQCLERLISPRKAEAHLTARRVQGVTGSRKKPRLQLTDTFSLFFSNSFSGGAGC